MEYNRTFTHRTYGKVGDVVFAVPNGKYTLNGTILPDASVAHLMTFALQTLQDAYAGAKSTDEALGAFNGKLDNLLNGTIGTRGTGDGADERTRVARSVVHAAAKAKFGAKSAEWATFTGLWTRTRTPNSTRGTTPIRRRSIRPSTRKWRVGPRVRPRRRHLPRASRSRCNRSARTEISAGSFRLYGKHWADESRLGNSRRLFLIANATRISGYGHIETFRKLFGMALFILFI